MHKHARPIANKYVYMRQKSNMDCKTIGRETKFNVAEVGSKRRRHGLVVAWLLPHACVGTSTS